MDNDSGDVFPFLSVAVCGVFFLLAMYWTSAVVLAGAFVAFSAMTALAARLFRWPVEKAVIPIALKLQVGKTRIAAWIGLLVVLFCLALSLAVLYDFQGTAVRRIGQGLAPLKQELGAHGEKIDSIAIRSVGSEQFRNWTRWLWKEDMRRDDTAYWLNRHENPLPAAMFVVSDIVNRLERRLERLVGADGNRSWALVPAWLLLAVVGPYLAVTFLITLFQLSVRRLSDEYCVLDRVLIFLFSMLLLYSFMTVFYLFPYVSHPFHSRGISFWMPTILYLITGAVCCGFIRANHRLLFSRPLAADALAKAMNGRNDETRLPKHSNT